MGKLSSAEVIAKYKKLYGDDGEFTVSESGKVLMPLWLIMLLIHKSGVKSRKTRILKKVLKKEFMKMIKELKLD